MKVFCSLLSLTVVFKVDGVTTAENLKPLLQQMVLQQQDAGQQQEQVEQQASVEQQVSVEQQASVEPGQDGFPKLPEVSKMLGTAEQTMQGLAEQTAALKEQVEKAQKERAKKMAAEKVSFEQKLHDQEMSNRALAAQNKQVAKDIAQLRQGNVGLRAKAKELQDTNEVMRDELLALKARLGAGQSFVVHSLESTDDSAAKELVVLAAPEATGAVAATSPDKVKEVKPHNATSEVALATSSEEADTDEEDEGSDEEGGDAPALLALGTRHRVTKQAAPTKAETESRELIKVLQAGVANLGQQERAGEAQLKALFQRSFKAGQQHHQSLMKEQERLNTTRASLANLQGELGRAKAHLEGTKQSLSQRLHGLGTYLQKLAHLALAPPAAATAIMKALPETIGARSATAAPPAVAESTPAVPSALDATLAPQ